MHVSLEVIVRAKADLRVWGFKNKVLQPAKVDYVSRSFRDAANSCKLVGKGPAPIKVVRREVRKTEWPYEHPDKHCTLETRPHRTRTTWRNSRL